MQPSTRSNQTQTHRHTQTQTHTHTYTHTYTDTQTHTDTHRHTQTHTDTHKLAHAHIHGGGGGGGGEKACAEADEEARVCDSTPSTWSSAIIIAAAAAEACERPSSTTLPAPLSLPLLHCRTPTAAGAEASDDPRECTGVCIVAGDEGEGEGGAVLAVAVGAVPCDDPRRGCWWCWWCWCWCLEAAKDVCDWRALRCAFAVNFCRIPEPSTEGTPICSGNKEAQKKQQQGADMGWGGKENWVQSVKQRRKVQKRNAAPKHVTLVKSTSSRWWHCGVGSEQQTSMSAPSLAQNRRTERQPSSMTAWKFVMLTFDTGAP